LKFGLKVGEMEAHLNELRKTGQLPTSDRIKQEAETCLTDGGMFACPNDKHRVGPRKPGLPLDLKDFHIMTGVFAYRLYVVH
jgi:hypothetical protein